MSIYIHTYEFKLMTKEKQKILFIRFF